MLRFYFVSFLSVHFSLLCITALIEFISILSIVHMTVNICREFMSFFPFSTVKVRLHSNCSLWMHVPGPPIGICQQQTNIIWIQWRKDHCGWHDVHWFLSLISDMVHSCAYWKSAAQYKFVIKVKCSNSDHLLTILFSITFRRPNSKHPDIRNGRSKFGHFTNSSRQMLKSGSAFFSFT